ncbi:MAG TPA: nucleotidyltransferase family protein [Chthoniobacteraceae bacterium]|jgi:glucose-1-phosphate thymidylyltransferase|nr:Nucleotidyl transferase [Chthoniobacter sp.]HEV7868716.1 nucleotidyltransferase family protein [Chthoniobacteraceae bacterium]
MNILILAAGYATRLYPLTENKAKPLLEVAGKPMMEWVIDNLAPIDGIEKVYVVTNHKFAADFQAWADAYNQTHAKLSFEIIDDGSTSDSEKLGAIGDINLVNARAALYMSDLIVVAGDNLFSESLADFGRYCREKEMPVLGIYDVGTVEEAKKYGVVAVDESGVITSFEEKPSDPKSTLIGIALYYYPAATVASVPTYIAAGNNPDQPGRFVQWLYARTPVSTWQVPGTWFDVGSKETLAEANEVFARFAK